MRKTNRNLKNVKFAKRLVLFVLVQCLIIVMFARLLSKKTIDKNDLIKETVVVEEVKFERLLFSGKTFWFCSNSVKYSFPKSSGILYENESSHYELYEAVAVGDILTVEYLKEDDRNVVYGAQIGDKVLRTVDAYNRFVDSQSITSRIVFAVVEFAFLAVLVLYVLYHYKVINPAAKKKRRNKKIIQQDDSYDK